MPVASATVSPNAVRVQYPNEVVHGAPAIDTDGELAATAEPAVIAYYNLDYGSRSNDGGAATEGALQGVRQGLRQGLRRYRVMDTSWSAAGRTRGHRGSDLFPAFAVSWAPLRWPRWVSWLGQQLPSRCRGVVISCTTRLCATARSNSSAVWVNALGGLA